MLLCIANEGCELCTTSRDLFSDTTRVITNHGFATATKLAVYLFSRR